MQKVLVICIVVFVGLAAGWGMEGHEAVAQVASLRLTSAAQSWVQHYLAGKTLEQIAPFPDDYDHTPQGRWSAPLHYCNLPRDATTYSNRYCPIPPGCVVAAITNYTKNLRNEGRAGPVCDYTRGDEPCPLEFLVHFVGDIHQPLHVGYGDDAGGNKVKVRFYNQSTNLHHVWDTSIIQKYQSSTSGLVDALQTIIRNNPSKVQQYISVTDPVAWANESFQLVRNDVYIYSNPAHFNQTADPNLGAWYYTHNLPVVQQRLVAAAVRLAQLLNTAFLENVTLKSGFKKPLVL